MKDGWQVKTLDEICEIARGGSPRPIKAYLTDDPDGVNWIKISDATASSKYIYKTKEKIKRDGIRRSRLVNEGDFILSNSMSFGRPYIMKTSGCIHDGWLVLSDKSGLFDQDYLYHFLGSPAAYEQFDSRAAGSTVRNLNIDLVRSVEVPLPPLKEQKRIVAILDEAFEGIEKAQANAQQNLANAHELFESQLNSIYEKAGNNWISEKLKKITFKIGSGATPKGGKNAYKTEGISLIRSLNVHDRKFMKRNLAFIDDTQAQKLSNVVVEQDDVLFNITGASIARCCIVPEEYLPARVNQHVSILRPKSDILIPDFLCYLLTSKTYKDALLKIGEAGSTRQAITKKQLEDLVVSFPRQPEEQKNIVEKLDQIANETQRLEAIYEQKLKDLAELKQSLLQKAFSGELTSRNIVAFTRPASEQQAVATTSPEFAANVLAYAHNWHASQQRDRTFGRVKAQKVLHMAESVAGVDMGRQPIKDAAGPNDFQHMLRAEDWARSNLFFEFTPRLTGNGYDFKKLGDYNKLIGGALETVKPYKDKLDKILALMMPLNTREAEVLATVHAAWNNLVLDSAEVTDDKIHEACKTWHERKQPITEAEFRKAITTIRNNGIVPDGTAKRVIGQESLLL